MDFELWLRPTFPKSAGTRGTVVLVSITKKSWRYIMGILPFRCRALPRRELADLSITGIRGASLPFPIAFFRRNLALGDGANRRSEHARVVPAPHEAKEQRSNSVTARWSCNYGGFACRRRL
ncbi:unnamed protein product [Sphenostylis stenocarpa]|uniref:Uncharacterized protein n=1 Tax=Sphenostylis stenocarpa TaxID=92480 RepID=A0AA86VN82_9FABA|nr:unnamed protein product [Sphenostylis stenocarpa]